MVDEVGPETIVTGPLTGIDPQLYRPESVESMKRLAKMDHEQLAAEQTKLLAEWEKRRLAHCEALFALRHGLSLPGEQWLTYEEVFGKPPVWPKKTSQIGSNEWLEFSDPDIPKEPQESFIPPDELTSPEELDLDMEIPGLGMLDDGKNEDFDDTILQQEFGDPSELFGLREGRRNREAEWNRRRNTSARGEHRGHGKEGEARNTPSR